jgi:hypothetical protein
MGTVTNFWSRPKRRMLHDQLRAELDAERRLKHWRTQAQLAREIDQDTERLIQPNYRRIGWWLAFAALCLGIVFVDYAFTA